MNNFRHPKRAHHRKALDGFLPADNRRKHEGSIGSFRRGQSYQPERQASTQIGNFRRADGFHAAQQSVIQNELSVHQPVFRQHRHNRHTMTEDTLVVTDVPKKRSKKARWWRRLFGKPKTRWGYGWRAGLALSVVVLMIGGFLFFKAYFKARQIFQGGGNAVAFDEDIDPTLLNGEGDGRINIMLLGRGGAGHPAPDLTDTILVGSIDNVNDEAALLSIPRDLWVSVPDYGNMKINAAYASAKQSALARGKSDDEAERLGLETIEKVIETTMGIPIHYYVLVDFEAFRQSIDAVGGVTVDVPETLYDASVAWENNNNPVIAREGSQTMNGKQALLYARSRHGSSRGDFDRTERQRAIILALKDKVLSAGTYSNPVKVSQLIDAVGDHVRTNLSVNEVMRLYEIGQMINNGGVESIGLADPPNDYVTTGNVGGLSVVLPKAGLGDFSEIQSFVRNKLKDGYIKKENASIVILNGTGIAGLATRTGDQLKSYGYNVTSIGDAPSDDYETTILVNTRGEEKKYTKNYLEKRFGLKAVTSVPDPAIVPGEADFVIILGQNETTRLEN